MANGGSRAWFGWLDPLRGFAAASVLGHHLIYVGGVSVPTTFPISWLHFGWIGVDLFYAISGAVIVLTLDHLQRSRPGTWRASFALRRIARVVPLYLLTGGVFVACLRPELVGSVDGWKVILAHLLFIHNWFVSTHGVINGPSWTLGVEMQFYALALVTGTLLLRAPLWMLGAFLVATAVTWRAVAWWYYGPMLSQPGSNAHVILSNQLPGVIDLFGAGILAARMWLARGPGASAMLLTILAVASWLCVLALLHLVATVFWSNPISAIGFRLIVAVAAGLSVAAALAAASGPSAAVARWSGDLSYGLYLWHMPVILLLLAHASLSPLALVAATLGITVLLSMVSFLAVERPFQRLARRRAGSTP